ncbi:MAG TPA: transglycosylase family protein [Solirubrobacterales bacterium]|nr:transglycosylase family protein [Solirubrobacterales bacterium]
MRRRRRTAALLGATACLLLVVLMSAWSPAEATTATADSSNAATDASAGGEKPECAEAQPQSEAEAEANGEAGGECKPPGEGSEEQPAPGREPPAAAPPTEEAEAPAQGDASGGTPTAATPRDTAGEGKRRTPAIVADAPLRAGRPRGGNNSSGAPGGAPHAHRGHRGGVNHSGRSHSGGTEPKGSHPPHWGWSGAWAIPWQIVACESGGDYGALNPGSGAGGAYQILPSTWSEYGGRGLPQNAPPAEQDRIAAQIWADSGPSAWVCAQNGAWLGAGLAGALGPLPDPLPPAMRLDPGFASLLVATARERHLGWAMLLAAVRMEGGRGRVPATAAELRRLTARIAGLGAGPLGVRARELFDRRDAQRLTALFRYDRAVGLRGLVEGLAAVKRRLERRVLTSPRLHIYEGGRADVAAGRVDVRVLTLLLYLAQQYRSVTVSSLVSGHSLLTTAGRPSLHAFGRAVDISALNGTPILGHQQPGGLTERALRRILLLPREMQPSELISLFDLGGPSFALPDHADHIHVGF